jgi:hypothetical protein
VAKFKIISPLPPNGHQASIEIDPHQCAAQSKCPAGRIRERGRLGHEYCHEYSYIDLVSLVFSVADVVRRVIRSIEQPFAVDEVFHR